MRATSKAFLHMVMVMVMATVLMGGRARADRAGADRRPAPPAASHPLLAADEAELARTARLESILRIALDRNPNVAEEKARAAAAEARARAAVRLPDLDFKYEQWGVPLSRPYALDRADTLMLGVRQTFPPWGALDARGQAADEEVGGARDGVRVRRQEVAANVKRTYATYYLAEEELRLHLEHVGLTGRVLELARLNQRTGHGSLQDVLRLELELTRVHTDVARIEREHRTSRALLNSLMGRPLAAPLGPPETLSIAPRRDLATLEGDLNAHRPEIGVAVRAVRRSEAVLDETRRAAKFPNLMIGIDYWYMPMNSQARHGYGAMVAVNLPWLSARRRDEERAAAANVEAEQKALESTKNLARYELHDAAARLESARQTFAIIDQDLLAQARRSLEATQAEFAAGRGDADGLVDALRSYLQVQIERVRALAELAASDADLARAAGGLTREEGSP